MKQSNHSTIPLLFFSFGFFVVLIGLFSKMAFSPSFVQKTTRSSSISPTPLENKLTTKVDFSRSVFCEYRDKTASISAAVQGNAIAAQWAGVMFLVNGDCLYRYQKSQSIGVKTCGVGQYVSMGKSLLTNGLISGSSFDTILKQMGSKQTIPFNMQAVLNSCKNVKEIDEKAFAVPKGVVFK